MERSSDEKRLELRLGPPGDDWTTKNDPRLRDESVFSTGYFSSTTNTSGAKRAFTDMKTGENNGWVVMNNNGNQTQKFSFPENPVGSALSSPWPSSSSYQQVRSQQSCLSVSAKESSQPSSTKVVDLQSAEKKAFSPAPANTAVPNSSQKRTAPAPVVGWPPIRSFRKNLASGSSSKPIVPEPQNVVPNKVMNEKPAESCRKGYFVKINMEGVPIGRKVDLHAYDSYEKLSSAIDELFRGLLAAQRDPPATGIKSKQEEGKEITGILDGSGEYTLVYEDNEGDRMLVGDVPWHMFVSTVKRLRVLRSSELSKLCFGNKQEKIPLDAASK